MPSQKDQVTKALDIKLPCLCRFTNGLFFWIDDQKPDGYNMKYDNFKEVLIVYKVSLIAFDDRGKESLMISFVHPTHGLCHAPVPRELLEEGLRSVNNG